MFQLQSYTTFGTYANAQQIIDVRSINQFIELLKKRKSTDTPFLILGSGSNILFTDDYNGTVLKNKIKGISIEKEDETHIWVKAASGEVWHHLVMYCVNNGWGGIENLSLIPGTVGAAPMQNIGAYGAEIKDAFDHLEAINIKTTAIETFKNEQCKFGYRESIFKHEAKGQYFITSVTLKLCKKPVLNTSYGDLENYLNTSISDNRDRTLRDVSEAVMAIRKSKLPDPSILGNAGSFFKNPIISASHFEILQKRYPAIKSYPASNGNLKIPAGWLIETTGWKGKRIGNVGVHEHQALVLVNYGGGTGKEILTLAHKIIQSVDETFGITLVPEVNII